MSRHEKKRRIPSSRETRHASERERERDREREREDRQTKERKRREPSIGA